MARMTTKKAEYARRSWQERAEVWRERIKIGNILDRMQKCADGKIEMKPTQLKAAVVLLGKVMPDLNASEIVKRDETINPAQVIEMLKQKSPELAALLAKDYLPVSHLIEEVSEGMAKH